jgi:hypothetical protein
MRVHQLAVAHNGFALADYALQRFKDEKTCFVEGQYSWQLHDVDYKSMLLDKLVSLVWLLYSKGDSSRYQELTKNVIDFARRLCRTVGPDRFTAEDKKKLLGVMSAYPWFATDMAFASLWAEQTCFSIGRDYDGYE